MTATLRSRARPWRRRSRVIGVALIAAAVVIAAAIVVPRLTTLPSPELLTDKAGLVGLRLPEGWIDTTPDDAGKVVTQDNSGEQIPARRLPDLTASTWNPDSETPSDQDISIDILHAGGQSLNTLHTDHVTAACADSVWCRQPRPVEPMTVDGHPALSQFLSAVESSQTLWTVTALSGDTVVRYTGSSTDLQDALHGGRLNDPLDGLRIKR